VLAPWRRWSARAARLRPLSAPKIVGEAANVTRFRSEACFGAMHAGVAPMLHRTAVTRARLDGPGESDTTPDWQLAHEDGSTTRRETRLARVIFNPLQHDTTTDRGPPGRGLR
jgi:transposase